MTTTLRFQADDWAKRLGVLRTVADGKSLPVLGCLRLLSRDGRLSATACDLERWLTIELGETDVDIDCLLPAHKLTDILRALPAGTDCTLRPGQRPDADAKHRLSAGKRSYVLAGLDPQDFPAPDTRQAANTDTLAAHDLAIALAVVLPAVNPGDVRRELTGPALDVDVSGGQGHAWWIGTDGHRMHFAQCSIEAAAADDEARILPHDSAQLLARLAHRDAGADPHARVRLVRGDNALIACGSDWRLRSAWIEARYPVWRAHLPSPCTAGEICLPAPAGHWRQALAPLLAVQSDLAHKAGREVEISASEADDAVCLRALGENPEDRGELFVTLTGDVTVARAFRATFDARYLSDALAPLADDEPAGVSIQPGAQRDDGAWGVFQVRRVDNDRRYLAKVMPTAPRHDYAVLFPAAEAAAA